MTLSEARVWIREYARNAGDSTAYTDIQIDHAVKLIGDRFCRKTKCVRTLSDVTLTASTAATGSLPATFRAEMAMDAWIAEVARLKIVDYQYVIEQGIESSAEGVPEYLAFTTTTAGIVYPTPASGYTMKLLWWSPLTSFAAGTGSPTTITLNIPEDILHQILPFGPTAVLQHNEPEHLYASRSWQEYLRIESELIGANGFGVKAVYRTKDD